VYQGKVSFICSFRLINNRGIVRLKTAINVMTEECDDLSMPGDYLIYAEYVIQNIPIIFDLYEPSSQHNAFDTQNNNDSQSLMYV